MRVPTADYSPIEQALMAKSNAIRAGYVAADASNWKSRHDNNLEQLKLNEKSLELDEEALNLNEWNSNVSLILSLGQLGKSAIDTFSNIKLEKDKQQFQIMLTDYDNQYKAALLQFGDQIRIEEDENGNRNIVKPQALIDLEKQFKDSFDSYNWHSEIKDVAMAGLGNLFASNELSYIESAMEKDKQAIAAMFEQNWTTALRSDLQSSNGEPRNLFNLIDTREDLSSTQKEALKLQAQNDFKLASYSEEAVSITRQKGLQAGLGYVDSLDLLESEKIDMRTSLHSVDEKLTSQAKAIGESIVDNMMANPNPLPSDVSDAYGSIDILYSDENGYNESFRTAMRDSVKAKHATRLAESFNGWHDEAMSSFDSLKSLYDAIDKGSLSGFFTNQDELKRQCLSALDQDMSAVETLLGNGVKEQSKAEAYSLKWQYENSEISWDYFVDRIGGMKESFGTDSNMQKFFVDILEEGFSKRNKTLDSVAKQAFEIIKTNINATDDPKLTDEQRTQLFNLQLDVYKSIGSIMDSYTEGIDSLQFKSEVESLISAYGDDYFDLIKSDASKVTVTSPEGKNASKNLKEILNPESSFIVLGEPSEAGVREMSISDSNVRKQVDESASAIASKYRSSDGLDISNAYLLFEDADGHMYLGFRDMDEKKSGFYFYDIENDTMSGLRMTPDARNVSESSGTTSNAMTGDQSTLKDLIRFKVVDGNNKVIDVANMDWNALVDRFGTLDELKAAIKADVALAPHELTIINNYKRARGR